MPILLEYTTGGSVRQFFNSVSKNHGIMWEALKGKFFLLIRQFVNIVRVWRAETMEELYKVNKENEKAIDNITRKYQKVFDESDGMYAEQYGPHFFLMHPGAALAESLLYSPIKNLTREETQQFMRSDFLGLDTFDSLKPLIQPSKDEVPDPVTTKQFDADGNYTGTMTTTYLKPNPEFNPLINRAIEAMSSIFGESVSPSVDLINEEKASGKMEGIAYVIEQFKSSGALDKIMEQGEKYIDMKEVQINALLESAPSTLQKLSEIIASENVDVFERAVESFKGTNKILKNLDPYILRKNLQSQLPKMKSDPKLMENIKKSLGKEEITDDDLMGLSFEETKVEFNNTLVEILEDYYEETRKIIVGDTTPEAIVTMQKTATGKRYADLINNSIKTLDNSLTSLGNVAKSNSKKEI